MRALGEDCILFHRKDEGQIQVLAAVNIQPLLQHHR